jgi:hypothetical protein
MRGRLGVERGERYALLPREVLESAAWNALLDWARVGLFGIAVQYNGWNNGCLALPFSQAKLVGIHHQWKLYAGFRVLSECGLVVCTRRGRLEAGKKLPSLYAVTWQCINGARDDVIFDHGIATSKEPLHTWAKWKRPPNWIHWMRTVARENHGREKNPDSTTGYAGRSTMGVLKSSLSAQPGVEPNGHSAAQPLVDTS